MPGFPAVTLEDQHVVLEPLRPAHVPELEAAAADGELWHPVYTSIPAPGAMAAYVEAALAGQAAGDMLPFAVRERGTGRIVGTTRYYEIDAAVPRLAIGYTWYARSWQKTCVNSACKWLLLEHAFAGLRCVAVAFHTDILNLNSQRAIAALGAVREGVLRAHRRRRDGTLRDTVCFSLLAEEWPQASARLAARVERLEALPTAGG